MKVIALASTDFRKRYICEVSHEEIEKFLGLYYNKLEELKIGEDVDLGKGYDYASDIERAMESTRDFIAKNKSIVNAIINGLRVENMAAALPADSNAAQEDVED